MASFTLTQASRVLSVSQHKLIHLCEKNVVVPDVRDAKGRGSSREFSKRNMFDFAIALEMRRLELPVAYVRAVLRVVRSFEREAEKLSPSFSLPESLSGPVRLTLIILDGERLYLRLGVSGEEERVFGGVVIRHPATRGRARHHEGVGRLKPAELAKAMSDARTKTEIELSRIAKQLERRLGSG